LSGQPSIRLTTRRDFLTWPPVSKVRQTMTMLQLPVRKMVIALTLLAVTALAPAAWSQAKPLKAEVRAVKGSPTYTIAGAAPKPIKVGLSLPANSTVQTGPDSSVDLFLGASAGVVRIAERSTVVLNKLDQTQTGAENVVDIQMNLPEGELYFNVNKLSQASRYEIKMPTGVAGIRGTKGRCHHRAADPTGSRTPPIVLVDGRLVFVHVPVGGEPKAYVMTAPPAVAFSPADGVKEAPADLVRGVNQELDRAGRGGPPFQPPGPPDNRPPVEPFISPNGPRR
jgi:hypothetical protein